MAPYENLRTIQDTWVQIEPFDEAAVTPDPLTWLAGWARPGMFLLLHADDGICWGKGVKQAFTFSDATVNARYSKHPVLIQTARLFDATEEVFLWRIDEGQWRARRVIDDRDGKRTPSFVEPQVLWGTRVEPLVGGFARMIDGEEGLSHVVPLALTAANWQDRRRLRLDIRHYLTEEQGWLRVCFSRLYNLREETGS